MDGTFRRREVSHSHEQLGQEIDRTVRYFRAYVAFFTKVLKKIGLNALFNEYVFSSGANWIDGIKDGKKQPQMVNRLLSGVLHPFIHVGYGIEFDSPGMMVEGSLAKFTFVNTLSNDSTTRACFGLRSNGTRF